jgi:hypothetical protein
MIEDYEKLRTVYDAVLEKSKLLEDKVDILERIVATQNKTIDIFTQNIEESEEVIEITEDDISDIDSKSELPERLIPKESLPKIEIVEPSKTSTSKRPYAFLTFDVFRELIDLRKKKMLFREIANTTGVTRSSASKYLRILLHLGFAYRDKERPKSIYPNEDIPYEEAYIQLLTHLDEDKIKREKIREGKI